MAVTFTQEQSMAIELHGRNILVSAAAGSGKTATILAVIGIFVGCLLPICGIALGVIGLLMAPKPKETLGKSTRPRILCMVTIALSILAAIFQALIAAGII